MFSVVAAGLPEDEAEASMQCPLATPAASTAALVKEGTTEAESNRSYATCEAHECGRESEVRGACDAKPE